MCKMTIDRPTDKCNTLVVGLGLLFIFLEFNRRNTICNYYFMFMLNDLLLYWVNISCNHASYYYIIKINTNISNRRTTARRRRVYISELKKNIANIIIVIINYYT